MKHIKKYEDVKKFGPGDYVLLDKPKLEEEHWISDGLGKIIKVYSTIPNFKYTILFDTGDKIYLQSDYIIRLLTPDEIEEFESKLSANKFNI